MCKLVWREERETVKWGLAGETGMQWLPLITEELSGGRWMESIWPQGVEPGLVQQIGGRWIGAQYLRRQTCSKKLRAASGEREFSSAPKQLEQRAGWVILTANMYGNAYRGGLSASSHCLLPCSPCERGTVSLSISLMGKWSLGEKDSVTWSSQELSSMTAETFLLLRMDISFLSRNSPEGIQGSEP